MRSILATLAWAAALAVGCGDDAAPTDTGTPPMDSALRDTGGDTGSGDVGPRDTAPDGDDTGAPDAAEPVSNIAFVTSTAHTGALGGLEGADAICAARAGEAGVSGSFIAFLSTSEVDAIDRVAGARGWRRVDGALVADEVDDLARGQLFNPIRVDELGEDIGAERVWTGSELGGVLQRSPDPPCDDWTSVDGYRGQVGRSDATLAWASVGSTTCSESRRIYCFQVDHALPQEAPANVGRVAFLGNTRYQPSTGGIADADALCQGDADAASLTGTFRALLAPTGETAASRFDDGAPWVRVDGVLLADSAADFFSATAWHTTLSVHADGTHQAASYAIASGARTPNDLGEDANNCTNWVSPGAQGMMGNALYSTVADAFGDDFSTTSCRVERLRLYCLEN